MTFLNPILLYAGLGCIAVPVVVHLLTRRRRKPIAWGAMRFLLEAYRKHRRRLTLEQLILLACRCALVALIALALGKPVVDGLSSAGGGPRVLYLAVDNSIVSSLSGPDATTALDRHKAGAARLLSRLDPLRGDRAALVALGSPAEPVVVPPSNDLAAVGRAVEALQPTESRADLAGALSRLAADLTTGEPGASVTVALLSEWRAGAADVERSLPAIAPGVRPGESIPLVIAAEPADDAVDNTSIVRAEPLRSMLLTRQSPATPASPLGASAPEINPVRVVLGRRGPGVGSSAVTKVNVRVDTAGSGGRAGPPSEAVVRWTPGQEQAAVIVGVTLPDGAGGAPVIVAEIDRDALGADNIRRRPIESRPWLNVGLATTPGVARPPSIERFSAADWLRLVIAPDADGSSPAGLRVVEIEPRTIGSGAALSGIDALVVPAPDRLDGAAWARAADFARAGGLVVVFPPAEEGVQLWADGFLGAVQTGWKIAREARAFDPPAELNEAPPASDLLAMLAGEFSELARPVRVRRLVPVEAAQGQADILVRLRDGTPVVLSAPPRSNAGGGPAAPGRGLVVLVTVPCDLRWSDLPTKPFMVPLFQEIIRQGIGAARGVFASDAGSIPAVPAGTIELRAVGGDEIITVSPTPTPLRHAGLYTASDARGSTTGLVAVNPDLAGADTTPRSLSQLTPWLGTIAGPQRLQWSRELSGQNAGGSSPSEALDAESRPPISAPLLAAAAAIALLELFLARWFSHAALSAPAAPAAPAQGARP